MDHSATGKQQSVFAVLKNLLPFLETTSHCRVLAWNFSFPIKILTHSACSVRSEQKVWIPRASKLVLFLSLWDFKAFQTPGLNHHKHHHNLSYVWQKRHHCWNKYSTKSGPEYSTAKTTHRFMRVWIKTPQYQRGRKWEKKIAPAQVFKIIS